MKLLVWIGIAVAVVSFVSTKKVSIKTDFERILAKGGKFKTANTQASIKQRVAQLEKKVKECCEARMNEEPATTATTTTTPKPTTTPPPPPPPPPFSAFSVASVKVQFMKKNDVVAFKNVRLSEGNDFNVTSSKYVCPIDGFYYFTFTLQSYALQKGKIDRAQAAMYMDRDRVVDVMSFNSDPNNYIITSSTNSALTRCRKGQEVYIAADFEKNAAWSFYVYPRTTFAGFLVKPQDFSFLFENPKIYPQQDESGVDGSFSGGLSSGGDV